MLRIRAPGSSFLPGPREGGGRGRGKSEKGRERARAVPAGLLSGARHPSIAMHSVDVSPSLSVSLLPSLSPFSPRHLISFSLLQSIPPSHSFPFSLSRSLARSLALYLPPFLLTYPPPCPTSSTPPFPSRSHSLSPSSSLRPSVPPSLRPSVPPSLARSLARSLSRDTTPLFDFVQKCMSVYKLLSFSCHLLFDLFMYTFFRVICSFTLCSMYNLICRTVSDFFVNIAYRCHI